MSRVFKDSAGLYEWRNNTPYLTEDIKAVVERVIEDVKASGYDVVTASAHFVNGIKVVTLRESKGTFRGTSSMIRRGSTLYCPQESQLLIEGPSGRCPEFLFAHNSKWGISPLELLASSNGGVELPNSMVRQFASSLANMLTYQVNMFRNGRHVEFRFTPSDISEFRIRKGTKMGAKAEDGMKSIRAIRQSAIASRRAYRAKVALWNVKARVARLALNGADIGLTTDHMALINDAMELMSDLELRCSEERERLIRMCKEV
jgi:hypothetical protein